MSQAYASQQPSGFKNHVENIAIVGASGTIGLFLTEALIAKGKKVTAITRADSKSSPPQGLHAVKKVDYDDKSSLVSALRGQEVLIITMNVMAPKDIQTKLIDAAVEAGVEYIMPNEYGADNSNASLAKEYLIGEASVAVRQHVEKTGAGKTHWIALTCSFWFEFSLIGTPDRYGFDFDKKALTLFDDGTTPIVTTTWPQCGRAVAAVFDLKKLPDDANDRSVTLSQFRDKAVLIQSFAVSQKDMLASVLRVTGDKESDWTITSEPSKERYARGIKMMKEGNRIGYVLAMYTRVFYPNGGGDFSHKVDNEKLGLPKESLDEHVKNAVRMHKDGTLAAYH